MMNRRRGYLALELMAASAVLATLLGVSLHALGALAEQRRAASQREMAVQEVANVLERATALPWSEVTSDRLAAWPLSAEASAMLPAGELQVSVDSAADDPDAKRLVARVQWSQVSGDDRAGVSLTTWVYRHEPADPKAGER